MIPETSFVYLAEAPALGLLKIGKSCNPIARMSNLKCKLKTPVRLIRSIIGGHALERYYHKKFYSHRSSGEWFFDTPEIRLAFSSGHTLHLDHRQHRHTFYDYNHAKKWKITFTPYEAKIIEEILNRLNRLGFKDFTFFNKARVKPFTFQFWILGRKRLNEATIKKLIDALDKLEAENEQ